MDDHSLRKLIDESAAEQHARVLAESWWHSIDLGQGQVTPGVHSQEELHDNFRRFVLPDDLRGKRVLDIGCWDGFYSFESERRGAEVVAVDCWRPENFFRAKAALGSRIEFHELSVYDVTPARLGTFDIVLFLGVLYHLRHPLLALERVCELTRETAIVESHVVDNLFPTNHPIMEFYEEDELGGQFDNWWGPNRACLSRMLRASGFARTEVLRIEPARAVVKAYRQWPLEEAARPSLQIVDVANAVSMERIFPRRGRLAFLDISVNGLPTTASRDEVHVEVGGYGIRPIYVGQSKDPRRAGITQINSPVPPGLGPGWTTVSITLGNRISQKFEIELSEGPEW